MPNIQDLSVELLSTICGFCDSDSILAMRLTNRTISSKIYHNFTGLLNSIKISFCQISLEILDEITQQPNIIRRIQHITIGTESLDQYLWARAPNRQAAYDELLRQEQDSRATFADRLKQCLLRLPNLKTIRLDDRPIASFSKDYQRSIGSSRIMEQTGINLRLRLFGVQKSINRQWMFAVVFCLLRDLKYHGMDLRFELSTLSQDMKGSPAPFDLTKNLPQDVFLHHLRRLEIKEDNGRVDFINGHVFAHPNAEYVENLEELGFRGVRLANFLNIFNTSLPKVKRLEIHNCLIGDGFNSFYRTNGQTLKFLSISNSSGHVWEWRNFFSTIESCLMLDTLSLEELTYHSRRRSNHDHYQVSAVCWEGGEAITAGLSHLHQMTKAIIPTSLYDIVPQIELQEAHQEYLAAKQSRPRNC